MSLFLNCQAGISTTFLFAFKVTGGAPLPLNRIANCHRPGLHLEIDLVVALPDNPGTAAAQRTIRRYIPKRVSWKLSHDE